MLKLGKHRCCHQRTITGLRERFGKRATVGLHLRCQLCQMAALLPWATGKQGGQIVVPVVALQRPVEHHQIIGQTPVTQGAGQTKAIACGCKWIG